MLRELQLCLVLAALVLCTSARATPVTIPEAPPFDLPGAGQPGSEPPFDTPPVAEAPVDAPPFGLPPAPELANRGNAGGLHSSAARELINVAVFHPRAEEFGLPDPFFSLTFEPGEPPQVITPTVPSSPGSASASAPEPSVLGLFIVAGSLILARIALRTTSPRESP